MIINPYRFGQPLLLDIYPNAAVAYSVRKLRTAYSGSALRVRRSSDNTESDIGFVANQLDTASLLSFVGAGNGFVTTWYDQSGNLRNATNTTAANQPRIVNLGVLDINTNGKAGLFWSDSSNQRLINTTLTSSQPVTVFAVSRLRALALPESILYDNYVSTNGLFLISQTGTTVPTNTLRYGTGTLRNTIASTTNTILTTTLHNTTNSILRVNNTQVDTGNTGTNTLNGLSIGHLRGNPTPVQNLFNFKGYIQEFILYTNNQTTNFNGIETNINSYYTVWSSGPTWDGSQSGMLNTYSGAAVAYSVRALNSAYTGPLIRVRRSSDNTEIDIFALYNGELDTTFLLNFVGAGNGFVTTWYDQSGNGNNVTQTTAANQPRIVNAGVLEIQNGKVTVRFDGSNDSLFRGSTNILNNKNYGVVFMANKWNTLNATSFYISQNDFVNTRFANGTNNTNKTVVTARRIDNTSQQSLTSISNLNNTQMYLTNHIVDYGNSDAYIYINNNLDSSNINFLTNGNTSATNAERLRIGSYENSSFSNINISEVIFYESSQNISAINTNINSYYNIYP